MKDKKISKMEQACRELTGASQGALSWMWDDRFGTVLAHISIENQDEVYRLLEHYFGAIWNSSNIKKAPDEVKIVDDHLGSLRSGQQLLTSDPNSDGFIYCAWWVWGDRKTISVRIAPYFNKASNAKKDDRRKLLKSWFGI